MAIFKCKMCGGTIEFNEGDTVGVCDSCGTKQTLPRLDSDRKTNLYDRANHFRRNNEFDKATSIYENILNEDPTDAEAYWSIVLCRYGIEYVEDPATHRRVPTVNRAQFTSIFDDEDYKSALKNADALQRSVYEDEAKAINEIQKGILEISAKEEPFDVFICYKETDQNRRRTPDSVLAADLYHQLCNEGFKVFFSRITLEDKLGTAYEPYIFAALNSAKAMVVLGTKPEHFNAVWVKNEWSRYLALIKAGAKKTLIPAYRDMDPYDLPEEFSHLQAQDMSKLGFMQDLIRGIKKIVRPDEPKSSVRETVIQQAAQTNTAPLLRRAFMFLEDGEWDSADEYCEKVLDLDPENAEAYLGKLMAQLRVRTRDGLKNADEPFDDSGNYKKAYRFGDEKLKAKLSEDIAFINGRNENERLENAYQEAIRLKDTYDFSKAAAAFQSISAYKDAKEQAAVCEQKEEEERKNRIYSRAWKAAVVDSVEKQREAIRLFESIPGWKDAEEKILACRRKIEALEAKEEANRLERERKAEEERIAEEKAAKKRRKIIAIVLASILAFVALIIVLTTVIIPNQKYNAAMNLYNAGQYEKAITAFEALNGYKDSAVYVINGKYLWAKERYQAGEYDQSIELLNGLDDYQDSQSLIENAKLDKAYSEALALFESERYTEAIEAFSALNGYRESEAIVEQSYDALIRNALTGSEIDVSILQTAPKSYLEKHRELIYAAGKTLLEKEALTDAKKCFFTLGDYQDASQYGTYINARLTEEENPSGAAGLYKKIPGFLDADERYADAVYRQIDEAEQMSLTEAIGLLESIPDRNGDREALLAKCRELLPYTEITYKGYKKIEKHTGKNEAYEETETLQIALVKGVPSLIPESVSWSGGPIESGQSGYTYSAFITNGRYTIQYDFSSEELRFQAEGFLRYIFYLKKTNG